MTRVANLIIQETVIEAFSVLDRAATIGHLVAEYVVAAYDVKKFVKVGLMYFFARRPLMHLFTHDPEVLRIGTTMLIFAAIYQLFDSMFIIYNGALRGAGDTFIPSIVTGLAVWTIMLCGGYVMARFFPQLGVAGPWTLASIYGAFLGVFMLTRFRVIIPKAVAAEQSMPAASPEEKPSATLPQLEPS